MEKLVRDLIPSLLREKGVEHTVRVLHDDQEYLRGLLRKVIEEIDEFYDVVGLLQGLVPREGEVEEAADVLESTLALQDLLRHLYGGRLEELRLKKRAEKGGFSLRQWIITR